MLRTKDNRHDSRVNSFAVVREGEVLPEKLGKLMETLGQLPKEQGWARGVRSVWCPLESEIRSFIPPGPRDGGVIFRIKGILALKNHPYKHVFHAVMDVSDEDDAEPWAPGEKRITKMVFIGILAPFGGTVTRQSHGQ